MKNKTENVKSLTFNETDAVLDTVLPLDFV